LGKNNFIMKICIDKNCNFLNSRDSEKISKTSSLLESRRGILPTKLSKTFNSLPSLNTSRTKRLSAIHLAHRKWLIEMATSKDKMWDNGQLLRIFFMDGSSILRDKVFKYASLWLKSANIKFELSEDASLSEIRITFTQKGSWSYVGTENLLIPENEPTMNFGWFDDENDDYEIKRTTLHEFGHALGCEHEHQSPASNIPWNIEAVYEEYTKMGWSKKDVDDNVFYKYDNNEVTNSEFDHDSIMLYPIDNQLTHGNFETKMNSKLSISDKMFISQKYPGATIS